MSIKSRKHPVSRSAAACADARALGLMLATLPGLALAGEAQGERVLGAVVVSEEIDDYKAEASSPKFTAPLLDTPQTVTVITKQLLDDQGVTILDPVGEVFDPTRHEAVGMEDSSEVESGHVTVTLQKGYAHGDRILRPALVKVAN